MPRWRSLYQGNTYQTKGYKVYEWKAGVPEKQEGFQRHLGRAHHIVKNGKSWYIFFSHYFPNQYLANFQTILIGVGFVTGRKPITNLDSILKSRDITLLTKVHLVKAMVFPVSCTDVSWSIKKTACQRINAFELWCWKRLLRVPWNARKSNQWILKEIGPE